ncbi:hypothetical protein SAMN02927916_1837 [Flavobacterium anhuiense]|uniref:Uncharacterized protein n=1 Tax=Flavobacterium anhuiense TaxID=459526 RepID=A0ABY0LLE3_9FLAO|nr:hypothetical protein [Flavobacterium anhuiense]SCY31651.1 hypothetical protein SAMN02927916_1837 [Flavobacterium anhuiense]
MAIQTLNTIKNWFKTTLKPSQQQFWDTWDSFRHKLDKVPVKDVEGIDELLNAKADKIALNDHIADINAHAPQVNTDWNSESGFSQLLNKPDFKTINGESVIGDGDITIEEGGLQNLDQTLANGNTSTKEMIFESNGGATTTYNNMGVLLRGNNGTNSSLSSQGFHTVGTDGLVYIENKGQITVSHFGGSTLQLENNEIRHTTIDGNSSFLQFDNSEQGHFIQTIQPKTGTIALLSDLDDVSSPDLQKVLETGNETYLEALFKSSEDGDTYENTITPKLVEIKRSNEYTPDKNEIVSLKSDLIEITKLTTGETTALFADGVGFGNSNSNNYSTLKLNPNTTANYTTVLMPAITEEGQTKTLATTEDLSLQGIVNANTTGTKNSGNATVDILKGEGEFVNSRTTIRSAANYNIFSSHEMGKNYHNLTNRGDDKEASIEMTSGIFSLNQTNSIDRSKITTVNFLPPTGNNTISFPAPTGNDGSYVLTTTDDFKTINGQSIIGTGDISSAPTLQQVMDAGSAALINGEAGILSNSHNGYSRFYLSGEMLELNNVDTDLKKAVSISMKDGELKITNQNTATGKYMMINSSANPIVNTELFFPNKETAGNYILATTDDFKTINGESIVGEGNIELTAAIPDGAIKVADGLALDGTFRNLTDNLGNPTRLWINNSSITSTAGNNALNNVAFGPNSMMNISSGVGNIAYGTDTLLNNTSGDRNTAIGHSALRANTTGQYNTAIGGYSLLNNTEGRDNTALGHGALYLNATGNENVALGYGSLMANTSGSRNVAIGYSALSNNQSFSNLAIGSWAMMNTVNGNGNIAIGEESLQFNTDGSSNTVIGRTALKNMTAGSWNIALGIQAGRYTSKNGDNLSCEGSIFLGSGAMPSEDAGSNEIVIGNFAVGAGNNSVTLGNNTITKTILKGAVSAKSYKLDTLNTAPTSSTDTGNLGEIRVTANYIYVCTATNTWVRSALTTW